MVNLVKGLPEGWNERNGITRSQELDPGRLSLLLKEQLKERLRFNLLTLKPELVEKNDPPKITSKRNKKTRFFGIFSKEIPILDTLLQIETNTFKKLLS